MVCSDNCPPAAEESASRSLPPISAWDEISQEEFDRLHEDLEKA